LVTVGFGGTLIEILADTLSYLAPVVAAEVLERLPNLRGFAILAGARGKPAVDLDGLAQLVSDFSLLAYDLAREGLDIDINPVFASGKDFLILDALMVPVS
jgi:acetyltransferase